MGASRPYPRQVYTTLTYFPSPSPLLVRVIPPIRPSFVAFSSFPGSLLIPRLFLLFSRACSLASLPMLLRHIFTQVLYNLYNENK